MVALRNIRDSLYTARTCVLIFVIILGIFPGGKCGRCVGLTTLPIHVPIVLKSRKLSLLELSGPVKACNGIALPYLLG
jgi:hypothetical protein